MISNAFKSATSNVIQGQAEGMSTTAAGVKSAVAGAAILTALGFSGGSTKNFMKALSGIGGSVTNATASEKIESAEKQDEAKKVFSGEEVVNTISSTLGDNPINRSATKQLSTVFELLSKAKESGMLNKKGQIETSIGDVDPTSELGKRIIKGE